MKYDLIVVGGGPSGCAAAITARRRGLRVLLIEAGQYPRHKVCGEFVSAESADVLNHLLAAAGELSTAPRIRRARLHSSGKSVEISLQPAAYSIPRFVLDEALWRASKTAGVDCILESVVEVTSNVHGFFVCTQGGEFHAKDVINASGRWSRLTRRARPRREAWIGLKAHFEAEVDDAVDLYFLRDGYCGVQAVSPGVLNACALMRQGTARSLEDVFGIDEALGTRAQAWTRVTEVFATAPVFLGPGEPVVDGMLQVGDAAGFVDPFVGDGISLALRSGVLAGRSVGALAADEYATLYQRAFSGIFRNTGRTRRLVRWARPLRPLLITALAWPAVSQRLFSKTRQARLDVLHAPIA